MSKLSKIEPLGFPWQTRDPFLMCVYHHDRYPPGNAELGLNSSELVGRVLGADFLKRDGFRMYNGRRIPGFPYHPHRGFETITICKQGFVDHFDSKGGTGRFSNGDAEWMTAGSGIQHSEMFPLLNRDNPNTLELFQIWLNLPAKSKLTAPHFKMLWNEVVPTILVMDEFSKKTLLKIYAGSYNSVQAPDPAPNSWAANPLNEVVVMTIEMQPHARWRMKATSSSLQSRALYFYQGDSLEIENDAVSVNHVIETSPLEDVTIVNGNAESKLLLLQGNPIGEPVVQKGPFVMNTEEEIKQAYSDYVTTQFGGWPWPEKEHTHDRTTGRFALYEDGTKEMK